jgi:NTE family protein
MLTKLGASSKLNAEWEFFTLPHAERRSAQAFVQTHAMDLGSRSTLNIDALLEQV